jgi:hypothetical protein
MIKYRPCALVSDAKLETFEQYGGAIFGQGDASSA